MILIGIFLRNRIASLYYMYYTYVKWIYVDELVGIKEQVMIQLENATLEKAKIADIGTLTQIKADSFKEEFKRYGFTPEDMISPEWHEHMIQNSIYYKIVSDNEIIGGINIFTGDHRDAYLCSLFIKSSVQNNGIGTKIIHMIENRHNDITRWQLETPSMSESNRHFYQKCGYEFVREFTPEGAPAGFALCQYEKTIR